MMSLFKTEFFKTKPYRLGLTLSGGGKCMAHIGLLQYLKEQGLEPDIISGASGGAMVGALHSAGYAPEEVLDFFYQPGCSVSEIFRSMCSG